MDRLWFRTMEQQCLQKFGFKYMDILHKAKRTGTILTLLNLALNMKRKDLKTVGMKVHKRSLHLRDNESKRVKSEKGIKYRRKKGTFDNFSLEINPSPNVGLETTPPYCYSDTTTYQGDSDNGVCCKTQFDR